MSGSVDLFLSLFILLVLLHHHQQQTASSSPIGINYGQVADNLPTPAAVLPLLRSLNATHVKLYDSNPAILSSFSSSPLDLTIALPDRLIPKLASSPSSALSWLSSNVKPFLPKTKISTITVGNEVLSSNNSSNSNSSNNDSLLPAMLAVHSALITLDLQDQISVTTAHSLNVLSVSYPPSAGQFHKQLLPDLLPLLSFLNRTGAPFLINAYPFFAYKADPKRISLDYVLFEPNSGVLDPGSGLRYQNMLHAQVDAVRSAIMAAGGAKDIEVRVSETGWPSKGDEDEVGATAENARKYNGNLMKMVASGKGTPMTPRSPLLVYVFALFNENLKTGPASERHYGLFNPDMSAAYDLGIGVKQNSTGSGSNSGSMISPSQSQSQSQTGGSYPTGFYTISAAPERLYEIATVAMAMVLGVVLIVA